MRISAFYLYLIQNKSEKEILEFINYLNLREGHTIKFIYVPNDNSVGRLACTTLYTMDSLFIQECIDKQANRIFPYLMSNFLVINDIYKRINMK